VCYVRDTLENITNIDSLVEVFELVGGGAEFFVEALVTREVVTFQSLNAGFYQRYDYAFGCYISFIVTWWYFRV